MAQRSQLLVILFVGTIFLVISLAGAKPFDGDCVGNSPSCCNGYRCLGIARKCCNGVCKDLFTDRENCGQCGVKCSNGKKCVGGYCGPH